MHLKCAALRNFLIGKLKHKYNTPSSIPPQNSSINNNLPKIWIRIPYFGKQSENLVKFCISKICCQLTNQVKFVIIYNTEKVLYFTSTKDKIPELSRNNVVSQITCPGCSKTYIGKNDSLNMLRHITIVLSPNTPYTVNTHHMTDLMTFPFLPSYLQ